MVKGLAYKHEDLNWILPCRKGRAASADNPTAKEEEEAGRSLGLLDRQSSPIDKQQKPCFKNV